MNSGFDLTFRSNGPKLPLSAAEGGTGQTSYAVGDILAASAATTLSKIALGAAGSRLRVNAAATAPEWARQNTTAQTSAYTTTAVDSVVFASGAAFTVTLITPVGNTGLEQTIIKTDSSFTNIITVSGTGLSTTLNTQGESIRVMSDGTNWQLLSRYIPSAWVSFTATSTWLVNAAHTGRYRRVGDSLQCAVGIIVGPGAPTAATLDVSLPSGLSIDTTKRALNVGGASGVFGSGKTYNAASSVVNLAFDYASGTAVRLVYESTAGAVTSTVTNTTPFTYANNMTVDVEFMVPISGWNG